MKKLHLLSTAAAALLVAAGAAGAQGLKKPERAPPALQHAPAEKIAPPMHTGAHLGPSTTGQGNRELEQDETRDKTGEKPDTDRGTDGK